MSSWLSRMFRNCFPRNDPHKKMSKKNIRERQILAKVMRCLQPPMSSDRFRFVSCYHSITQGWIPADLDNFTIDNKPAHIKRGATLRLPYVLCQRESEENCLLPSWRPHKQLPMSEIRRRISSNYLCPKLGVEYQAIIPFYSRARLRLKKAIIFLPLFISESLINMLWKI